jgi:hypothetical protein
MTGTCRFCGKQIRRTREGFWGTTDPNDGHPWYCPDDVGDDKRHEPAPEEPVDSGPDCVVTVTDGSGRKEMEIRAPLVVALPMPVVFQFIDVIAGRRRGRSAPGADVRPTMPGWPPK